MRAADTAGSQATPTPAEGSVRLPTLAEIERQVIEYRLALMNGNRSAVAKSLGICSATLYNKLRKYKADDKERADVG